MKPSYEESMLSDGGSSGFKAEFTQTNHEWSLLSKLYQKYEPENKDSNKIPKKIHQVWLGSEIPLKYKNLTETWVNLHKDWEYRLWTDKDLSIFNLDKDEKFQSVKNQGKRSDILRYFILNEYGGVYADTDFICVKNLEPLLKYEFFGCGGPATSKNQGPIIFNGLFGSVPKHPILKETIKDLNYFDSMGDIMEETGPGFFTKKIFNNINEDSSAVILPLSYFYPLPAVARFNKKDPFSWVKPESFGIHLWESSWQ